MDEQVPTEVLAEVRTFDLSQTRMIFFFYLELKNCASLFFSHLLPYLFTLKQHDRFRNQITWQIIRYKDISPIVALTIVFILKFYKFCEILEFAGPKFTP